MNDQKNYYQILQVSPQAEPEVIEAAHKRLARKYHPDVNGAVDATTRMQEINEAYSVLGDSDKRAEYDKKLAAQSTPPHQTTQSQQAHTASQAQKTARTYKPSSPPSTPSPGTSPIELKFKNAWRRCVSDVTLSAEYQVLGGRYRLDFAHPPTQIGVELDGREYHTDPKAFTRDRRRDRELQQAGWRVLHFSGYEINQDVERCVYEVRAAIESQARKTSTPSVGQRSKPKQKRKTQEPTASPEIARQPSPSSIVETRFSSSPSEHIQPTPKRGNSWFVLPAFVSSCLATLGITIFSCIGIIMLSGILLVGTCWGISAGLRAATTSLEASTQHNTGLNRSHNATEQHKDIQARVTVPALNVRQSPGADAEKVGKLFQDERLVILEEKTSADGRWVRVRREPTNGQLPLEGWINAQYIEVEASSK